MKHAVLIAVAFISVGRCGLAPAEEGRRSDEAASVVRVVQADGKWWFRSPQGKVFLSIGANHVEPFYWRSPRNADFVQRTYGAELFRSDDVVNDDSPATKKWSARVGANFKNWGFNTLGFHNPLSKSLQEAVDGYYVCHLPLPVPWGWNMKRSELVAAFAKRPTDLFDAEFRDRLDVLAEELVEPRANDPRLLGYAYTDGPPWTVEDDVDAPGFAKLSAVQRHLHPWVHALMSLPAAAAGKQAWIDLLKQRYDDPATAAAVYAVPAATWDQLAARTQWTDVGDAAAARADDRAFLNAIMRRWYEQRHAGIRSRDRTHLIFGDKLNMNRDRKFPLQLADSLDQMRGFVDVILVQYYAPPEEQRTTLAEVHRLSGLPIVNGDTACKPFWPDDTLRGENPEFLAALGRTYDETLTTLFAQPWFIGWHHCGYVRGLRQPYVAALSKGDAEQVRFYEERGVRYREGFITDHEVPIDSLVLPLKAAIARCEDLHRNETPNADRAGK